MRAVKFIIGIMAIIMIAFVAFLLRPNYSSKINGQHYIAHAGGAINGFKYTNSKEAVENAIAKGIKFIELDFCLTTDSILVCTHDWKTFNIQTGVSEDSIALSYKEFKKRKIHSELTPLSIFEVDSILTVHSDVFLVTDKISSPTIIDRWLKKFKNRLVIECFSYDDYEILYKKGYYLPMFSYTPTLYMLFQQRLHQILHDRDFVICNFYAAYKPLYKKMKDSFWNSIYLQRTSYSIFWTETKAEADSIFEDNKHVHFIYVDEID